VADAFPPAANSKSPAGQLFSERELIQQANKKLAGLPCKSTVRGTIRLLSQVVRTRPDAPRSLRVDTVGNFFLEPLTPHQLTELEQQLNQKLQEQMTIRLIVERAFRLTDPEYARSRRMANNAADAFISNPRRFLFLSSLPLHEQTKKLGIPLPEHCDPASDMCKEWLKDQIPLFIRISWRRFDQRAADRPLPVPGCGA
jgi:hypothetical protein